MSGGPLRIGIVGAGSVVDLYLPNLLRYPDIDVRMITDRHPDRAESRREQYGIPRAGLPWELFAADDIEAVLNLTPPGAHAQVAEEVLAAGKHLYSEKPLTADRKSGARIIRLAEEAGLIVGSAPDITLGTAFQAALRFVADGSLGTPVFARCEAVLAGPESWHPRPQFLYARGGGPLFDIGPYYLTALVAAFGPIASVTARGTSRAAFRTIGSGPLAGEQFPVEVPSLTTAILGFASGVSAQLLLTFDSPSHRGGWLELFGTSGTLRTPDPNGADVDARFLPAGSSDWADLDVGGEKAAIGPGVVNFARHIRGAEPLVADGRRAFHVLDVMCAIEESMETAAPIALSSTVAPTPVLNPGWNPTHSTLSSEFPVPSIN